VLRRDESRRDLAYNFLDRGCRMAASADPIAVPRGAQAPLALRPARWLMQATLRHPFAVVGPFPVYGLRRRRPSAGHLAPFDPTEILFRRTGSSPPT